MLTAGNSQLYFSGVRHSPIPWSVPGFFWAPNGRTVGFVDQMNQG
jgi:hypothetical protein